MKKFLIFFLIFMIFSVSAFADVYLKSDILEAIKNSTSYDDTESIIKENSSDIGIDSSAYDDLTSEEKEEVMEEITGSEFGSIDDLKNKFNELVAEKTECIIEATLEKSDSYYMGTVNIHNLSGSAVLSIAKYKDGKLVSLETREYINDTENFDVYDNTDTVKIMLWNSILDLKPLCKAYGFKVFSAAFLDLCNSTGDFLGIYKALISGLYEYSNYEEIMSLSDGEKMELAEIMWNICREYETVYDFDDVCNRACKEFVSERVSSGAGPGSSSGGGSGGTSNTQDSAGTIRT